MTAKPAALIDQHLEFLDELRASGEINMFGARPYLAEHFALSKSDSAAVLTYWMQTFSDRS